MDVSIRSLIRPFLFWRGTRRAGNPLAAVARTLACLWQARQSHDGDCCPQAGRCVPPLDARVMDCYTYR